MDDAISQHQQRLDSVGNKIAELERTGHAHAAARLRSLHERVSGAFAELRRAYADDWRSMQADADEGWDELGGELREVDKLMLGWHEEEVEDLDQSLDDLTHELDELHADSLASRGVDAAGLTELRAEIAEAKKRRQRIPTGEPDAVASYSTAVRDAMEHWRKLNQ
jgi:DNA repair exonuclease SbcCD ATPase subunit